MYQGQAGLPTAFANDGRVFQSSWHGQVIFLVAQGRAVCEVGSVVLFIILNLTEVPDRKIHCAFVNVCKELYVNRNV